MGIHRKPGSIKAQKAKRMLEEELKRHPELIADLQQAQADSDEMAVDHEFRITMMELGLTEI